MEIRDRNSGIIISTSRKINPSFTGENKKTPAKMSEKKSVISAKLTKPAATKPTAQIDSTQDKETKYAVIGGLAVLGGLALAIVNREKVLKVFGKEKNQLKKYLKPTVTIRNYEYGIHGGPDIDLTGGPKALHTAWSKYIEEIETNRKNNAKIFKRLKDAFTINAKKADELEALAQKRLERRGGIWA